MKMWIGKLCAVMVVGLVFLGAGVLVGARRPSARFERISEFEAFDTKTGQRCSITKPIAYTSAPVPQGITLDPPGTSIYPDLLLCDQIARQ
jgi:hypothetical protein